MNKENKIFVWNANGQITFVFVYHITNSVGVSRKETEIPFHDTFASDVSMSSFNRKSYKNFAYEIIDTLLDIAVWKEIRTFWFTILN